MASQREYLRAHPHRESPESRKKSNRKYRISLYGLTREQFGLLLEAQDYACGMCHEPFEDGQLIHIDHDHDCCPDEALESVIGRDVTGPYSVRHTFASLMDDMGVARQIIADMMGHRDVTTFERAYRHRLNPQVTETGDIMDQLWGGDEDDEADAA